MIAIEPRSLFAIAMCTLRAADRSLESSWGRRRGMCGVTKILPVYLLFPTGPLYLTFTALKRTLRTTGLLCFVG